MFLSKVEEFCEFEVKINVNLSPPVQGGVGGWAWARSDTALTHKCVIL